jgi:hypothetical protein
MSRFGKENSKEFRSNNLCSKKTKQVTSYAVRIINDFLNDRGNERSWLNLSKEELAVILEDFYAIVRTKNGELYNKFFAKYQAGTQQMFQGVEKCLTYYFSVLNTKKRDWTYILLFTDFCK